MGAPGDRKHHLGTLLGLLVAAMELNAFKEAYPKQVRQKVIDLRRNFLQMQYCFLEKDLDGLLAQLQALI